MELKVSLSSLSPQVSDVIAHWPTVVDHEARPRALPSRPPAFRARLGPDGVAALIQAYRKGTTASELAINHGVSVKTIKRLLASEHGRLKDQNADDRG